MQLGGLPGIDAMHPYKWMRTKDEEVQAMRFFFFFFGLLCSLYVSRCISKVCCMCNAALYFSSLSLVIFFYEGKKNIKILSSCFLPLEWRFVP